jgi:hypothetical protein
VTAIAKEIRRNGAPALAGLDNVQTTPQFHDERSLKKNCVVHHSKFPLLMSPLGQKRTLDSAEKYHSITVACLSITERTD